MNTTFRTLAAAFGLAVEVSKVVQNLPREFKYGRGRTMELFTTLLVVAITLASETYGDQDKRRFFINCSLGLLEGIKTEKRVMSTIKNSKGETILGYKTLAKLDQAIGDLGADLGAWKKQTN